MSAVEALDSATPEATDATASVKTEARSESATKSDSLSAAQLREDLSINDNDLDGCMTEQAGLYGYYASLYARAQMQADQAKTKAEIMRAKCYKRHRNRLTARGLKFSEAVLEAEVLTDDEYIRAQDVAAKYKMKAALAKEALEALKHRKDMLIQKGVARREEMKGETFVKTKEQASMDARERAREITAATRKRS